MGVKKVFLDIRFAKRIFSAQVSQFTYFFAYTLDLGLTTEHSINLHEPVQQHLALATGISYTRSIISHHSYMLASSTFPPYLLLCLNAYILHIPIS
jgi:hypothetical protein